MKTILSIIFVGLTMFVFAQTESIYNGSLINTNNGQQLRFPDKKLNLVDKYSLDSLSWVKIDYNTSDTIQVSNSYFTYDEYGRQTATMRTTVYYPALLTDTTTKITYEYFENPDSLVTTYLSYNQSEHVFVPSMFIYYVFDENGNYKNGQRFNWSTSENAWILYISFDCEFDAIGNQLYYSQMVYVDGSDVPTGGYAEKNEFNSDNKLVNYLRLSYETSTQTMDSTINTIYTYDINGNLLTVLGRNYNVESAQWLNNNLIEDTYENNLLVDSIRSYFSGNIIIPSSKVSFEYDGCERIINRILYNWDSEISDWKFLAKSNLIYDESNRLIETINYDTDFLGNMIPWNRTVNVYSNLDLPSVVEYYQWDTENSVWDTITKNTFIYDEQSRVISNIQFNWDNSLEAFVGSQKFEYNYDFSGNQVLDCEYRWDYDYDTWVTYYCFIRSYDEQYSFNDLVLPVNEFSNENFGSMLLMVERFGNELNFDYTNYYYSQHAFENNITNLNLNDLAIFPNPTTSIISVVLPEGLKNADFSLFDMQGRCIIEKSIQSESQISVSELSNGLYFYKVVVENEVFSGKLIKN
ncbi:MAG TPA: T9SS type A sorting domain-containing protein [Bacteroidales bacterium]|nr:T9SS type A sorting domain-containing protein [Bacteroidales bacterium]